MKFEDFSYVVESNKNFDDSVIAILKSAEEKGWALFNVYDVKERLAAKGFLHEQLKIIEICSARYSDKFLKKNKFISLCMPCRINVIEDRNKVNIVVMRASVMAEFFEGISKEETLEIENDIKEIINNSIK